MQNPPKSHPSNSQTAMFTATSVPDVPAEENRSYARLGWSFLAASIAVPVCFVVIVIVAWPLAVLFAYGLWLLVLICLLVTASLNGLALFFFTMNWIKAPHRRARTAALTTLLAVSVADLCFAGVLVAGVIGLWTS